MTEKNKPRTRKRNVTERGKTVTRRGGGVGGSRIGGGLLDHLREKGGEGLLEKLEDIVKEDRHE